MNTLPVSLYIHIPWCIKKCPYCDFNSHVARHEIPEKNYLAALIADFKQQLVYLQQRQIQTIFIGGGTPSLLSANFYHELFKHIKPYVKADAEITLEANPGTIDTACDKFQRYREIGINRLSLGIQSLQDQQLKYLGRMHSSDNAIEAIQHAKASGFSNFNVDLMFGLTHQTIEDGVTDLQRIITHQPTHISWYQLTIEPNTYFYRHPPRLPEDDYIYTMQQRGQHLLEKNGYQQYEVSAYTKNNHHCQHNLNYWLFGDYIGIGAGAHGKITLMDHTMPIALEDERRIFKCDKSELGVPGGECYPRVASADLLRAPPSKPEYRSPKSRILNGERYILRTEQHKNPSIYMNATHNIKTQPVLGNQYLFEFMLNALRLKQAIPYDIITQRCFVSKKTVLNALQQAAKNQLVLLGENTMQPTEKGLLFLNDILLDLLQPTD